MLKQLTLTSLISMDFGDFIFLFSVSNNRFENFDFILITSLYRQPFNFADWSYQSK